MADPGWGLLPDAVMQHLRIREWGNRRKLKRRLQGSQPFPFAISLKPPQGPSALADIGHFQRFIQVWRDYPYPVCVHWENVSYRHLAEQRVPVKFVVADVATLANVLGAAEQQALQHWQARISCILAEPFAQSAELQRALFNLLIEYLEDLEHYSDLDMELLLSLVPQLKPGIGNGGFLRALPVKYVDTKFLEQNYPLIEQIVNLLYAGDVLASGGLLAWLNCQANPKGWLWVRPLCERTRAALGGMPLLQLATDTLLSFELPARRILVVENVQSGLALPPLEDSIAVFGGGKNVAWLSAKWLQEKHVGYWGDIDSEGLCILADARRKLPSIDALMMNEHTLLSYQERMVDEPLSVSFEPTELKADEHQLFRHLRVGKYGKTRLEQERISPEHIAKALSVWLSR